MATQQPRRQRLAAADPTSFEQARDELFQHIMQCDVIGAASDHQAEWFDETMAYIASRYPELSPVQIVELRTLGERFSQPPKSRTEAPANAASAA
jgi:hypothetical protein